MVYFMCLVVFIIWLIWVFFFADLEYKKSTKKWKDFLNK